jgi:DNA replication initiation complex subunit (GINS family)
MTKMPPIGSDKDNQITFQELGEIQSAERGSTSLTRLPDQFFEKASTYLKSLIAEMENCTSDDSSELDETYYRISEEYRRSKDILERIYSTRERKIVLMALNASRGINQKTDEMVHDEEELYFSMKVELEDIRERILRYDRFHRKPSQIRPETGINTSTDDFFEIPPEAIRDVGPTKAPMMDKALADLEELGEEVRSPEKKEVVKSSDKKEEVVATSEEETSPKRSENIMIVRAMADIEPFIGPGNKTYSLKKEDITSLPREVADILMKGNLVQEVEEG